MDTNQIANLEAGALALLQKKNPKAAGLQVFQRQIDTVPSTGKPIFRLGAFNPASPDKSRVQIVVDETGAEVDTKTLGDREAKLFFGGDFWPWYQYSYSVKFVCGTQPASDGCCCAPGVRTGIYSTEINIHNYQSYGWAWLQTSVIPLIQAGTPQGREPRIMSSRSTESLYLPPGFATMEDCCRLNERLFGTAPPAGQPLNVGFLEIVSNVELKVTAVYTATDLESKSVSIDVEDVSSRLKSPYYYPYPYPLSLAAPLPPSVTSPAPAATA